MREKSLSETTNKITFLILSDLHCVVKEDYKGDSMLDYRNNESEFADTFKIYLKNLNKKIDHIICAGDISNKACTEGFKKGWGFLKEIEKLTNADSLVGVPGNHDHQSRERDNGCYSPDFHLKYITPIFPSNSRDTNTRFWAWNWSHINHDQFNTIILNSSAYHGFDDESRLGRVPPETRKEIVDYVNSKDFNEKAFNILISHHHFYPLDDIDLKEEYIRGGSSLLEELQMSGKGAWLVIHGHNHFPLIRKAIDVSGTPPIIFSAGSFSAKIYPQIKNRTSNQFYIVEVNLNETNHHSQLIGSFEAYEFHYPHTWRPSQSKYLPFKGGFGSKESALSIAKKLEKDINKSNSFLDEEDLGVYNISLNNLLPTEKDIFESRMRKNGYHLIFEGSNLVEAGKINE